jgi:hypothetical protein
VSGSGNKIALITGASSGIGAEFAIQLAGMGYNLILAARREEKLRKLSIRIQERFGITSTPVAVDLSRMEGIYRIIEVIHANPDIELLINNAGFGTVGKFSNVDPGKELSMLHVHVITPVMLCRAIIPGMIARQRGAIINVSSFAGLLPIRNVLYGSTKSFLVNFSLSLQDELRHSPILIQALCPGFVLSEFHDTEEYTNFSRSSLPKFLWMTPEYVVKKSLECLHKQKVICTPGTIYSIVGRLARNSLTIGFIKSIARFVLRRKKYKSS